MTRDDFNRMVGMLLASLAVAALLQVFCPAARAEGWYNPGIEGGVCIGEYDLADGCLYYDKTDDSDTYLCRSGADEVTQTCGSVAIWVCNASGCDLAGELGSVTSLDATTLATIVAAISGNGSEYDDDASVCWGADDDACIKWDTAGTPDSLQVNATDCDGIGTDCTPVSFYESGGDSVLDLQVDSVTNSSAKITIGPPGTSSHLVGADQLHITASELESDALVNYLDGKLVVGDYGGVAFQTYDSAMIHGESFIYTGYNYVVGVSSSDGRLFVITDQSNYSKNHGLSTADDPGIRVFSITDPTAGDSTQYSSLDWNRVALGGPGGGLGCINQTFAYTDFTDDGGASGHLDLDEQIPIGADVQKMILHSLTGFTGDATAALTVGDDGGVDADRYHSAGTLNVVASSTAGVDCGAPSGTTFHAAAVTVRIVLTGSADFGNFSAGEATVSICYWTP